MMSPETTINQLGGHRFIAMTGAKNFVFDRKNSTLTFQIGRGAKNAVNYVKVRLNGLDLYDVSFYRKWGTNFRLIVQETDLYFDQLQPIFTENTGFYTSF